MLLGLSDKIVKIYGFCNVCGLKQQKLIEKQKAVKELKLVQQIFMNQDV